MRNWAQIAQSKDSTKIENTDIQNSAILPAVYLRIVGNDAKSWEMQRISVAGKESILDRASILISIDFVQR
jgi:hypothetical protein